MCYRVDNVIRMVSQGVLATVSTRASSDACGQVREYHRKWKEDGVGSRDVVIIAHGHFNRVLISRWINFPLSLGILYPVVAVGKRY